MNNIHPTMQAALAPFAPRRYQPNIDLDYDGVPMRVEYDYFPAERAVYDVDSPLCGPGCPADVDISGVYVGGHNIIDLMDAGTLQHLSATVLEKLGD